MLIKYTQRFFEVTVVVAHTAEQWFDPTVCSSYMRLTGEWWVTRGIAMTQWHRRGLTQWSHAHMMLSGEMSGDRRSIDHIPDQTPRSWVDILSNDGRKEGLNLKISIICLNLREFSTNVKMSFNWRIFKTLYTHDLSLASCIIWVSLVLWSGAALILVSPSIRLSDHLNTKSLLS